MILRDGFAELSLLRMTGTEPFVVGSRIAAFRTTCLIFLFIFSPLHAIFTYDRMIAAGQHGNFAQARAGLNQLMVKEPERIDVRYDSAVAAYKTADFQAAYNGFEKVAQDEKTTASLQELASFNAGNAAVKQKELEKALQWYENTLLLNPDNEQAKHNRDVVKKMLQQQKQQEKNDNNNKPRENQSDDSDQNQNNGQSDSDQEQKRKESQAKRDYENNPEQQKKESKSPSQPDINEKNQEQKNPDTTQNPKSGKEPAQFKDEPGDQKERPFEQRPEQKKDEGKKIDEKFPVPSEMEKQEMKALAQKLDPSLMRFLESQEKKDAQANKQLMKAMVSSKGGPRNEDHNW